MIIRTLLAAAAVACHAIAAAQDWPSRPIHIVVPYPPGGSSDIIARAISQPLVPASTCSKTNRRCPPN